MHRQEPGVLLGAWRQEEVGQVLVTKGVKLVLGAGGWVSRWSHGRCHLCQPSAPSPHVCRAAARASRK